MATGASQNGRVMAIDVAVAFSVLGLFSNVIFTVIFLVAVVLVVAGLALMRPA